MSRLSMVQAIISSWKNLIPKFEMFDVSQGWHIVDLFDLDHPQEYYVDGKGQEEIDNKVRIRLQSFCEVNFANPNHFETEWQIDENLCCMKIRPLILSGLEHNNRWKHLNHHKDLPKSNSHSKFECGKLSFKSGIPIWNPEFGPKGSVLVTTKRIRALHREGKITHIREYKSEGPIY